MAGAQEPGRLSSHRSAPGNAFYYYSRLRDIEPSEARRGILEIANRFALLAERELASQRYQEARGYVGMALHIDPANASLLALKPLTDHPPRGLIARLTDLFSRDRDGRQVER
jgi:hypothetical protein